MERN
jgi:hypothetical protein